MNKTQKGFAVLESLLILVIIAIIGGTGYYVWHSKAQTDKNLDNASNSSQSLVTQNTKSKSNKAAVPATATKYLTIKEWGIRIPYNGEDTFSYHIDPSNPGLASIISADLSKNYDCTASGAGMIIQFAPSDGSSPSGDGPTVKEYEAQHPGTYKIIGDNYYLITHDQSSCSGSVTADAQNQANQTVIALQPKIEAIPQ